MDNTVERHDVRLDTRIHRVLSALVFGNEVTIIEGKTGRTIEPTSPSMTEVLDNLTDRLTEAVQEYVSYKIKMAEQRKAIKK